MNDRNKIQIDDLPFFARFLENQMPELPEVEAENVVGGKNSNLSISDEVAKKYGVTILQGPTYATNKYPSDAEDAQGSRPPIHPRPIVTLKYPSDGDEEVLAKI